MREPDKTSADDRLPEWLAEMSKLTEATFDGVFIYDGALIVNATQKTAQLFGRPDLDRCPVSELLAAECRPLVLQHLHSFNNGPCPALGLRGDGSSFALEVTIRACLTLNGRKVQVLGLRDLTREDFRTDAALNRSRTQIDRSD